ncbi:hypothetical protein ACFL96_13440 [Thermoproteota archaeon]
MKLLAIMLLMLCTISFVVVGENLTDNLTENITENITEKLNWTVKEIKGGTYKDTLYIIDKVERDDYIVSDYFNVTKELWIDCDIENVVINLTSNVSSEYGKCLENVSLNHTKNTSYNTTRTIVRIVGKDYDAELTGHLDEWEKLDFNYWEQIERELRPEPRPAFVMEPIDRQSIEGNNVLFYVILTLLFLLFVFLLVWKLRKNIPKLKKKVNEKTPVQVANELFKAGYDEEYVEKAFNDMVRRQNGN